MKIQIFTDYAIRVLLHLHKSEKVCKAVEIADAVGISYPSFVKLAKALRRRGLVDATKGRYGGYVLKKPAKQISVYDVYSAINGELDISPCLERKSCINEMKEECVIFDFFISVQDSMVARMKKVKISDLAEKMGDKVKEETGIFDLKKTG